MYTYAVDNNYSVDATTNSAYGFTVASEKILEQQSLYAPYEYVLIMDSDKSLWELDYSPKVISGIIAFDAKTGSDWLESVKGSQYGNYKIIMKAQIIKTEDSSTYSNDAEGSIVYTNAKMNAQFVSRNTG